MNLIDKMMDKCVYMNKSRVPDGSGGNVTTWTAGAEVMVAITNDVSTAARIAESEGFTNTYTLTTTKENELEFHDVIKRLSDGLILRVTNDNIEFPSVSTDMINKYSQVTAEKWSLPV